MHLQVKFISLLFFTLSLLFASSQAQAATVRCPLSVNSAYQYRGNASVYFVTPNCTKQVFSGPSAFLQRFSSWKKVKIVSKALINKVPNDVNYKIYYITKTTPTPLSATPLPKQSPVVTIPAVQVVTPTVPKKFLTIVAVNSGASAKYQDNSWEGNLKSKEDANTQLFEVAIWNNGVADNPGKVSLYKFGSTFDPYKTEYVNGGSAWVNHRESFNILNISVPQSCTTAQGADYYACSKSYLDAFKRIFTVIVANQPAEHYGVMYLGHGSSGGLFENKISEDDSKILFSTINSIIGKKIDFLNWSTNCTLGTYDFLSDEYHYADYILASDLVRGGFSADWLNDAPRLQPTKILNTFFSPGKTIKQSLIDMVVSERKFWETQTVKNDMVAKQLKQSVSIYDTAKFEDLVNATHLNQGTQTGDVLNYIRKNYPAQEQKFNDFRFHYVHNKDFFSWGEDSNGLKF